MSVELTAAWYGTEESVRGMDVLEVLKSLHASGVATVDVGNETMGSDPLVNELKTLFITYTVNGETKKLSVTEFRTLTFADLQ
jgi:hypothetical protein